MFRPSQQIAREANRMPQMSREETLRVKLDMVKQEHRDLDQAIAAMAQGPTADQLALSRLKKRKLLLKDEIQRLEDRLYPDIIA
jgi:hypothetical protein